MTASLLLALTLVTAPFSLRGRVVDPSGAAIAGAAVIATPADNTTPRTAVTDARGDFALTLESGRYTLVVAANGFREAEQNIMAGAGDRVEIVLQIAGVSEAITVTAPPASAAVEIATATKTLTPLRDVPQSVTVIPQQLMKQQLMTSIADVVRYVPGVSSHQGENNRDQIVIRGNSSSADFFVNGVRDDVQYYRDTYNLDRIEALKGPNAMIFGRGGAGGVINRVTKQAGFGSFREITVQAGTFGNRRITGDVDEALGGRVALRVNGLFEDSDSFRQDVGLQRYGVSPAATFVPGSRTLITMRYEYLHDRRVADRGIPSFRGRPVDVDRSTFYGNPSTSRVNADVNLASVAVEHHFERATVRNQTLIGHYDRGYQNFVPGAVSADCSQVALSAYNNATARTNVFNQTDVTSLVSTGSIRHTILVGGEIGRQQTDNFRNTGYFNGAATSIALPSDRTITGVPIVFRQSATDADNHLRTAVAAAYAQNQVELSRFVQVLGGLRFDRFDLRYHNNRNGDTLRRPDTLLSPRAGVVLKPVPAVSIYGSYSVSYLPSSGDQFSSLTTVTEQVKPEKFNNYETGVKWDARGDLSFTAALYRLDRTNTRSTDPNDPTRIVQTGSQRTSGIELGVNGHPTPVWQLTGGYAWQDAEVTSATVSAAAGARVAQVPKHTFSLWNHYQVRPRVAAALGVLCRSDMFAAIDNTVTLPGYVRADAAGYVTLTKSLALQLNVENLLDRVYYVNADSNTNISPGAPRTVRVALTTRF